MLPERHDCPFRSFDVGTYQHGFTMVDAFIAQGRIDLPGSLCRFTDDTDTVKGKAETGPEGLAAAVADWRELQEKLAVLHSRFRFRQISPVSMHNSFDKALRTGFGLDELEQEITGDIADMSARVQTAVALLEQQRRSAFRRQFRWVSVVAAGAAACVVSVDILTGILSFWKDSSGLWIGIALLTAVGATGGAAMWAHRKLSSDGE